MPLSQSSFIWSTTICNITNEIALGAFARMKTNQCRREAERLLCEQDKRVLKDLPNTCSFTNLSLRGAYVGCYADRPSYRLLSAHKYQLNEVNSPTMCVNLCLRDGYRFAALEYKNECMCGDSMRKPMKVPNSTCMSYKCRGNTSLYCGGYKAASVYTTGIIDKIRLPTVYVEDDGSLSRNVQILFLLQLNGRNIRQVKRMLRLIFSPKHLYIVHVDIRQNFMFEEMRKLHSLLETHDYKNMYIMETRYATIWGGANLLSMIIDAIGTALNILGWNSWDFLFNLSESDFPLLSLVELEQHLFRYKGHNFFSGHELENARFIIKQGLDHLFLQCEDRMWKLGRRDFPHSLRLDGGSDWIGISRDFAAFTISDDHFIRELRSIFANVLLPVESFFHTAAANSIYCNRTIKGNLRLTNWNRRQGCKCPAVKKIVDWCGCSPLVIKKKLATRSISLDFARNRSVFFARKFDSLISQGAVGFVESLASRMQDTSLIVGHISFNKTWMNTYSLACDKQSDLLTSWSRSLITSNSFFPKNMCVFDELLSLYAFKEVDESSIDTIMEISLVCGLKRIVSQLLLKKVQHSTLYNVSVNGFTLRSISVGSRFDLKEEMFRNYEGVLSDSDVIITKLIWYQSTQSNSTSNFTSPSVIIKWSSLNRTSKITKLEPYRSINGVQFGEIFPGESSCGEWNATIHTAPIRGASTHIATVQFLIYSSEDNCTFSAKLISKYFRVVESCSDSTQFEKLPLCRETSWSYSFPDPKSELFT